MTTLEDDIRAVLDRQARAMHVPTPHLDRDLTMTRATAQPRPRRGWMLATAAVLIGIVIAAVVLIERPSDKPAVITDKPAVITTPPDTTTATTTSTTTEEASAIPDGWVALAAGYDDGDIYLMRAGSAAQRIAGSDDDAVDQICPTFSPDSTRLAYGQATGTEQNGYQDAGLVVAEVTADGVVSATTTIPLDDMSPAGSSAGRLQTRPPCAIWSADGRWLAFGAGIGLVTNDGPVTVDPRPDEVPRQVLAADQVWVVDTETNDIRRLPGVSMTDIEWAPDTNELYIVDDFAITVYSVATGLTRQLADDSWDVTNIAVSPDGKTMAVQGLKADEEKLTPRESWASIDLRLMGIEGTGDSKHVVDRGVIAMDFETNHGIGPVWSPDGRFIAYQRVCGYTPDNRTCREQHEVVVVTVDDSRPEPGAIPPLLPLDQLVIPPPATAATDGSRAYWWPYSVVWSSDSTTLVYDAWSWPDPDGSQDDEGRALLAVRVDGATPPVILYDAEKLRGTYTFPPLPLHGWSQLED